MDQAQRTPLHYAALEGDAAEVRRLLAAGADPDAQDAMGYTPLHMAAQERAVEAGRALLDAGASVDLRDIHGNTPLWVAVFSSRGDGGFIEMLRARGADPLAANKSGRTPVGAARLIGNFDVAQFFTDVPEGAEDSA